MQVTYEELVAAWKQVRKGGRAPGVDGVTLTTFAPECEGALHRLTRALRTGTYLPRVYRTVLIPKDQGRWRPIQVATVEDRLVQRLLLNRLQPLLEICALPSSFAYRPHIGVDNAFAALRDAREAGFRYVLETDIRDCFESIDLTLVEQACSELGLDRETVDLIMQCISAGSTWATSSSDCRGLPQGAVLSPALCNLVLTRFDRAMDRPHRRLLRYADDMLVMCRSPRACETALGEVEAALRELGLEMNLRKTGFADFETGFHFLGAQMVGSFILPQSPAPYARASKTGTVTRKRTRKLEFVF